MTVGGGDGSSPRIADSPATKRSWSRSPSSSNLEPEIDGFSTANEFEPRYLALVL